MPFGFLVPAFLAGLAVLAVPLILHMRQRDRKKPTPWPSLMFLARMPVETDQRRRLTDLPLLLLRALALTLLVAAFARPFLRGSEIGQENAVGLTVLLLDRSASMDADGVREAWADSALAAIERLATGRRVAVVGFDASATILAGSTTDHSVARAAVAAAPEAAGPTRYGAGLRAAAQLLAHEPLPGEIVIVTDLQRSGLAATTAPALPTGTQLTMVALVPETRDNAAVVAVDVEPAPSNDGRRVVVAARVDRRNGDRPRSAAVVLEVDGREVASQNLLLPTDGPARVTFDTVALARSEARVTVRVEGDGLTNDDARHLVVPADIATRITLVAPADSRPSELRYVEQALKIGRDPVFTVVRVDRLDRAAIAASSAIVMLDAAMPEGDVLLALDEWLSAGGGLVVVPGERLAARRASLELLGSSLRGSAERSQGAVLGDAETSHPSLSAFRESDADAFAAVRVRRHAVVEESGNGTVLLRYDDGQPALVSGSHGAGRTMLVAIPLDTRRGDFPLQPAFLPFLRGVTAWATGDAGRDPAQESGQPWLTPASLRSPVVRSPSGELARPDGSARFVVLREAGIHEVFDGRVGGVPDGLVAVNAASSESDLEPMAAEEILLGVADAAPVSAMAPSEIAGAQEAQQRGWRWLLLALLIVLALEAVVASRGWRGVAAQSPVVTGEKGVGR